MKSDILLNEIYSHVDIQTYFHNNYHQTLLVLLFLFLCSFILYT